MGAPTTVTIRADHPALAGHFPGIPMLPGVLLLDETLRALEQRARSPWRSGASGARSSSSPCARERRSWSSTSAANGSVRFYISSAGQLVAKGTADRTLRAHDAGQ